MSSLELALVELQPPDELAAAAVSERAAQVLRPRGALQRLDEIAVWLAGWQRTDRPCVRKPEVILFAADHGVCARGVSAYPSEVTAAVVHSVEAGIATSAVMAKSAGASLRVIDVGVGRPSGDICVEDAMTPSRFEECLQAGRKAVNESDADLLIFGEMGIGNTTAAAALCNALFGGTADEWVGRGTGVDEEGLRRKEEAVRLAVVRVGTVEPWTALQRISGCELAAMAGAIVAARDRSIPVILDGFVVTAAAAALFKANPIALDHCIAGHRSAEAAHGRLLELIDKQPLLDLGMRLGEGSGALAALPLVSLAANCVVEVATFAEAGLS